MRIFEFIYFPMKITFYIFFFSFAVVGQNDFKKTDQFFASKQFSQAETLMVSYVKAHPKDEKGIELLGDAYGHQKKWDQAIDCYKKLVQLRPTAANYHYKYGGALGMKALSVSKLQALGIIGDVKKAFTTAANLDPKHIETRWALVELYMQLPTIIGGSKSKSMKYAEELHKISKVDGFLAKGYIYEYDKDFDAAEKYYKLAVTEGGSLHCYDKLTSIYKAKNQPENMIATMEAAYDKHKSNALNYDIGKVSADYQVDFDKGEKHLQLYIKNYQSVDSVSKAWAHYRLAQIYKHQNHITEALTSIELSLSESPTIEAFKEEKAAILKL